ncbi:MULTISPECIES: hypothetical protein [Streptacidiphilus]|uniref:Lipoprotein n=1 Tax=Streptacidiphilus cavernicola TaxID=3342716 RepID=A0ABV6UKD4_9ACTN|nr:hypothetical protein [Streptacidiphilus jeojiense]
MGDPADLRSILVRRLPLTRLRDRYGASPLHLLLVLCSFALALYAGLKLLKGNPIAVALWFVGAALIHDLVLLPLYTLADRALQHLFPTPDSRTPQAGAGRVNYVRIPALVSLLLLVVWYPLILRRVPGYRVTTGLSADSFLGHWLLITAALFAGSGLCLLAGTVRRARGRKPPVHKR